MSLRPWCGQPLSGPSLRRPGRQGVQPSFRAIHRRDPAVIPYPTPRSALDFRRVQRKDRGLSRFACGRANVTHQSKPKVRGLRFPPRPRYESGVPKARLKFSKALRTPDAAPSTSGTTSRQFIVLKLSTSPSKFPIADSSPFKASCTPLLLSRVAVCDGV